MSHQINDAIFDGNRRPAPFFRAQGSRLHVHTSIVDIGGKPVVARRATARGSLLVSSTTLARIRADDVPKGRVRTVAEVAALQAIKRTPEWLPLCHPLPVTSANVEWSYAADAVTVTVHVATHGRTGVEMEALTGVSAALLTVWDMTKSLEKDADGQYPHTRMTDIVVTHKHKDASPPPSARYDDDDPEGDRHEATK